MPVGIIKLKIAEEAGRYVRRIRPGSRCWLSVLLACDSGTDGAVVLWALVLIRTLLPSGWTSCRHLCCSTQERRAARRELKTLAKTEAVSEEEQAKRLAELELREQEELLHSQLSDTSQVTLVDSTLWCTCALSYMGFKLSNALCLAFQGQCRVPKRLSV